MLSSASARNNSALVSKNRSGKPTGSARRSGKQSGNRAIPEQGGLLPPAQVLRHSHMLTNYGEALSSALQFRVGSYVLGNSGGLFTNCAFRLVGIIPTPIAGEPIFKVVAVGPFKIGRSSPRVIQSKNGVVRGSTHFVKLEDIQTVAAFKAQAAAARVAAVTKIQALVRGFRERLHQPPTWPRLDPSVAASMDALSAMSEISAGMLAEAEAAARAAEAEAQAAQAAAQAAARAAEAEAQAARAARAAAAPGWTLPPGWREAVTKGNLFRDDGIVLPGDSPAPAGSAAPVEKKRRKKQRLITVSDGVPFRPKQLAIVEKAAAAASWGTPDPSNSDKLAIQVFHHNHNGSRSDGESETESEDSSDDSDSDDSDDSEDDELAPKPQIDTNIKPIVPASNAANGALSPATPAQSPNPVASSAAASSSSAASPKKRKRRGGIDLVDWDPVWFQKRRRRSATTRTYSEMKGKDNFKEMPTVVHMANSVSQGNNVELAVSWVISEDPEGPWRHV